MKKLLFITLLFVWVFSVSAQTKDRYYFTYQYYYDKNFTFSNDEKKKAFNGVKMVAFPLCSDLTEGQWYEYRVGWYRRSNRVWGVHPLFNIGGTLEGSTFWGDNKNRLIIEPGLSLAFHWALVNLQLNNYLTGYFFTNKSFKEQFSPIHYISIEWGLFYHRYDFNFSFNIGHELEDYRSFYSVLIGCNVGILIGKMKLKN